MTFPSKRIHNAHKHDDYFKSNLNMLSNGSGSHNIESLRVDGEETLCFFNKPEYRAWDEPASSSV